MKNLLKKGCRAEAGGKESRNGPNGIAMLVNIVF